MPEGSTGLRGVRGLKARGCEKCPNKAEYRITYTSPIPRIGSREIWACKNHLPWGIAEILSGKGIPKDPFVIVYPQNIKGG